jgi:hypothetical protein
MIEKYYLTIITANDNQKIKEVGFEMLKEYEGESESEKGYWADVHYYMEQNDCDKETAIKAIDKIYEDYCKKRNEQFGLKTETT